MSKEPRNVIMPTSNNNGNIKRFLGMHLDRSNSDTEIIVEVLNWNLVGFPY